MAIKNLPNFDDIPNSENLDANDSNEDLFEFLSKLSTDELNNLLEEAKDLLTQVEKGDSSKYKDFSNKLNALLEDACGKNYEDDNTNGVFTGNDILGFDGTIGDFINKIFPDTEVEYEKYNKSKNEKIDLDFNFDLSEKTKEILTRHDKLFSKRYIPFTDKEFIDEVHLNETELSYSECYVEKFAKYLPERWFSKYGTVDDIDLEDVFEETSLGWATIGSVKQHDNVFIKCNTRIGENSLPVTFLFYKNENGKFEAYIPKYKNPIYDDSMLSIMRDIFTEETYSALKAKVLDKDKRFDICLNMIKKKSPDLLYDAPDDDYDGIFYNPTDYPIMTINKLGKLNLKQQYKQIGSGYVYIGDIELNDSDETKYFLSDFSLKTKQDNTVELYARTTKMKLSDKDLHSIKDNLQESFIDNPLILDETDLKANTDFCYVDLTNLG